MCHSLLTKRNSVQEDSSTRYVAEENIDLLPHHEIIPDAFPREIGKWFKRWDGVEGVFVSNIRDEYPDD
jgi:F-box protein 21